MEKEERRMKRVLYLSPSCLCLINHIPLLAVIGISLLAISVNWSLPFLGGHTHTPQNRGRADGGKEGSSSMMIQGFRP